MGRRFRGLTGGGLILASAVTACATWRVPWVTPQEAVSSERLSAIQIREKGGARYVLANPRLLGDSLTGFVKRNERRVALTSIDAVAVRKFNLLKTVTLIVIVPVASTAALVGLMCLGDGCSTFSGGLGSTARLP